MIRLHRDILGGGIRATKIEEPSIPSYLGLRAAANINTVYIGSANVPQVDTELAYPTIGEVGEFSTGEVKTYVEFDVQEYKDILDSDALNNTNIFNNLKFFFSIKINSLLGDGHVGASPNGYTSSSNYVGDIAVFKYINPNSVSNLGNININSNISEGDELRLDITNLIANYIDPDSAFDSPETYFGLLLRLNFSQLGSCGVSSNPLRTNCSGLIFDNFNLSIEDPINYPVNEESTIVRLRINPNQNIRITNV